MIASVIMFVLEGATFALIVAIAVWAYQPRRKEEFERAAQLPFRFDADSVDSREAGR